MTTRDLLIELGTEELPPTALKKLALAFRDGIVSGLKEKQLSHGEVQWFATPRRLAVIISDLIEQAADEDIEQHGPPADKAKDANGEWTKAALGFAKKNGVEPDQLGVAETPKGPRLSFKATVKGANTKDSIGAIVEDSLNKLPIPKRMRWGSSRTEFVRPVHWLVLLYGTDIVDAEVLGLKAGNETRGHRFHCDTTLAIANPSAYESLLEESGHVIADYNKRQQQVKELATAEGEKLGGVAVIEQDLLDEVTALVEWPVALTGSFEERFLEVPAEALIYSMSEHQKYFHVVDKAGQLMPNFITISNLVSNDPAQVIDGNERVIRPRLSDAAFFYETDQKTKLADRREKLKSIVFQKDLGTLFEKTERVKNLAKAIAKQIGGDETMAERAAILAKNDLVTEMVFEFDKMQGLAGYYYAKHDGEADEVAKAMFEQYLPKFAGDKLPETKTGAAIALADRLDTLAGIFGIGQPPTGSKDPFALRRATLGVLRIIVESGFDLDLRQLLSLAISEHHGLTAKDNLEDTVLSYMVERFRAWYEEDKIPVEVFMAVQAKGLSAPLDIDQRVKAVYAFSQLPEAQALAAANKRVSNILSKLEQPIEHTKINTELLTDNAEKQLAKLVTEKQQALKPLFAEANYQGALENLAELRESVDSFFDDVMVMVDDEAVKQNRLQLLKQLRDLFLEVADISLLVPAK